MIAQNVFKGSCRRYSLPCHTAETLDLGPLIKYQTCTAETNAHITHVPSSSSVARMPYQYRCRYKRAPDAAREDYIASFAGERFAEPIRYVRAYLEQLVILGCLLPGIETPVLIINDARDPVVPQANAEYLHERLPKSRLEIIDAGHFIWEDAADTYAGLVTNWWAGAS